MPRKMTNEEATRRAQTAAEKRGGMFLGFIDGIYINQRAKVKLSCGCGNVWFSTSFFSLVNCGCWCPVCAGTNRPSQEIAYSRAEEQSKKMGGEFLGFVGGNYVNSKTKVVLQCAEGHQWSTNRFDKLVSGYRWCPVCRKTGFNIGKAGYLYVLVAEDGSKLKIGISNDATQRFEYLRRRTPFSFDVLHVMHTTGKRAHRLEKYFHEHYPRASHSGKFDGCTEWLQYSKELINDIESLT